MQRQIVSWSVLLAWMAVTGTAHAQLNFFTDGSDGDFNPLSSVEIDLGLAADAAWNTPSPVAGNGVYDAAEWAVVFKYNSVNIPDSVTVTFKNHPSGAPVVWLVNTSAVVAGTLKLSGGDYNQHGSWYAEGGPGGFRGGRFQPEAGGFGPGGGEGLRAGGSHATAARIGSALVYGSPRCIPLIGGSGSGSDTGTTRPGTGGGGALLFAVRDSLTLSGTVDARGGKPRGTSAFARGSGGAVRIVASTLGGGPNARILATTWDTGESDGAGRIRIETQNSSFQGISYPIPTYGPPGNPVQLWPDTNAPSVRVLSVGGASVTSDPRGSIFYPSADINLSNVTPIDFIVETRNIDPTWTVRVRMNYIEDSPGTGTEVLWQNAAHTSGGVGLSIWTLTTALPNGFSAIQVHATAP